MSAVLKPTEVKGEYLYGIHFSSTEQFIMYKKCQLFGDNDSAAAVLDTDDPAEQQSIGRNAKGFNGNLWA